MKILTWHPTIAVFDAEYRLTFERENYASNDALCIRIFADGELFAVLSVNHELTAGPGCIWLKDYGENEPVVEALRQAQLDMYLAPTGRRLNTGYVTIAEYRLL